MSDKMNIPKLIMEVRKRPLLWDGKFESRINKRGKLKCWEEIASIMIPEYHADNTAHGRMEKAEIVRKKWKYVSDYYKKEKKGELEGHTVKYLYASILTFLDPYINYDRRTGKKRLVQEVYEPSEPEVEPGHTIVKCEYSQDTENEEEEILPLTPKKKAKKLKKIDPLASADYGRDDGELQDDADKQFLLSFLPDIRTLSKVQKLEFKIQMLQILKDIRCSGDSGLAKRSRRAEHQGDGSSESE